jgi:hypothetical protein
MYALFNMGNLRIVLGILTGKHTSSKILTEIRMILLIENYIDKIIFLHIWERKNNNFL